MDLATIREKRRLYELRPISRLIAASASGDIAAIDAALAEGARLSEHEPMYGRTALHLAADKGSQTVAAHLLSLGAPLDALDDNAMTPLMCACSTGKKKGSEVALLLLNSGASATYTREADGMDALRFALWGQCSSQVINRLLELGAKLPDENFKVIRLV